LKRIITVLLLSIFLFTFCACAKAPADPYKAALLDAAERADRVTVTRRSSITEEEVTCQTPQARELARQLYDALGGNLAEGRANDYAGGSSISIAFYDGEQMLIRASFRENFTEETALILPDHRLEDPERLWFCSNGQYYSVPGYSGVVRFCSALLAEEQEGAHE